MKSLINHKPSSLLSILISLTLLFVLAQFSLFFIHYKVSDLIDSMVTASIALQLLHPVVLLPFIGFILLQITAYSLFIGWVWFMSISFGELFQWSKRATYWLGVFIWLLACFSMLELNMYYFSDSFFAKLMTQVPFFSQHDVMILGVTLSLLSMMTVMAYINFFWFKRYRRIGSMLLLLGLCATAIAVYQFKFENYSQNKPVTATNDKPNIILIGLDSLRPDFTSFSGNPSVQTPNVDNFLSSAAVFSAAYTPLARTFPAWISILTAKYPKHSDARNNLVNPALIMKNDTLARKLQQVGYETIYATDEKRFSNISEEYGFDRIVGPNMGVNDFLLGGLSDFPLSNLLVNLPIGRFLFPYNYANRAAAITYEPDSFLQLVNAGITNLPHKPVFLAVHLCLSHWPFTWADKGRPGSSNLADQYRRSVNGVDSQLGTLLQILKDKGLLENSWVVLLSDHGTALGLPGDQIISEATYQGDKRDMKVVPKLKLSSASPLSGDRKHDYTVNTAYGQGTNVLSLTQNHVLMAFKRFGGSLAPRQINELASLLDIAPTLLDVLDLPPLSGVDGISMRGHLSGDAAKTTTPRAFFIESGDSLSEIETDHIYIEKVIKHEIGIYTINPRNGLLMMDTLAEQSIIKNKQLAILSNGWMLAHYPAKTQSRMVKAAKNSSKLIFKSFVVKPYFVLVNVKTGLWTVKLSSPFAKSAPTDALLQQLKSFYGDELPVS